MLIDKVKELQKAPFLDRSIVETEELFEQMAQALIAVDDVLKAAGKELLEDLKDGKRNDGKWLLLLQIRKAIESRGE